MIGVSRSIEDTPEEVRLFISNKQLPYILSKPLHGTQRVIEYLDDGAVISIKVILNFELEQTILGLGKSVKVLSPNVLVDRIRQNISETNKFYQ
jgi:predicted DNA-binding transcriptional regulator YafY